MEWREGGGNRCERGDVLQRKAHSPEQVGSMDACWPSGEQAGSCSCIMGKLAGLGSNLGSAERKVGVEMAAATLGLWFGPRRSISKSC